MFGFVVSVASVFVGQLGIHKFIALTRGHIGFVGGLFTTRVCLQYRDTGHFDTITMLAYNTCLIRTPTCERDYSS